MAPENQADSTVFSYISLRKRINLVEQVVERLQPILARLPSLISETVLLGRASDPETREDLTARIESEANAAATSTRPPSDKSEDLTVPVKARLRDNYQ
ncbi:hypothetical protein [Candidatus Binatus sp.]|uniref:hypothetical protein n=1 Tax=Candidatus Binatus sp. TaxID=2811406 RepID=UPI003CC6AE9C